DIPVGLKNIIMKCTEKEPVSRYRHADDVLSALVYYKDVSEPYEPVKKEEQEKTMVTPIPAAKPSEPVKAAEQEPVSKENNEAETEPKKKRRKWPWILFILLFLLAAARSEEHTSELQSRFDLVC